MLCSICNSCTCCMGRVREFWSQRMARKRDSAERTAIFLRFEANQCARPTGNKEATRFTLSSMRSFLLKYQRNQTHQKKADNRVKTSSFGAPWGTAGIDSTIFCSCHSYTTTCTPFHQEQKKTFKKFWQKFLGIMVSFDGVQSFSVQQCKFQTRNNSLTKTESETGERIFWIDFAREARWPCKVNRYSHSTRTVGHFNACYHGHGAQSHALHTLGPCISIENFPGLITEFLQLLCG